MPEMTTGGSALDTDQSATPAELVRRAAAMRGQLRAQQDDAEARGHYGQGIHDAFVSAGFYHLLAPKRYGGLEIDLPTYLQVVMEISRGDPSTGWCYCLAHGHNLTTAAHWPEEAQDDVFRTEEGYYRASHSVAGVGTATPVEGGFVINARSPYQSGVPYSTHATVNVRSIAPDADPSRILAAIVPRGQYTVLDDWGGEVTLGQRGSGSNTVVVSDTFVPATHVTAFDWIFHDYDGPSVGTELHGNPMYLGPVASFFHTEFAAIMTGAARAAIDEYEQIITTRPGLFPPFAPRVEDPFHLADLGMALTMADAAEGLVLYLGRTYLERCEAAVAGREPFTMELDHRLYGVAQRAAQMACEAVELLFRSAGSTAARGGQPMQRYFRDISMYRGHISAQYQWTARRIADMHLAARAASA